MLNQTQADNPKGRVHENTNRFSMTDDDVTAGMSHNTTYFRENFLMDDNDANCNSCDANDPYRLGPGELNELASGTMKDIDDQIREISVTAPGEQ